MRNKFLFLLLLALIAAAPANATVLFLGGEDVDFTRSPSSCVDCTFVTSGSTFRSAWSRGALQVNSSAGVSYWLSKAFTPSSSIWFHAQSRVNYPGGGVTNLWYMAVWSPDGTPSIVLRSAVGLNQLKISKIDESGTLTDLTTCPASSGPAYTALQQFDMNLVYGASGSVTLYFNGASICSFSGDVTTNSRTQVNQVALLAPAGTDSFWSEIIVADADTRAKNLLTLAPSGNGNTQGWSGASPCTAILNQLNVNDANFISTTMNNVVEQCTVTGTIPAGAYNVDLVAGSMRGLVGGSGPQHLEYNVRTGGADYFSPDQTPNNVFNLLPTYFWLTNPATSSPWATTDLSDVGFNIGVKSTP